MLTEIMKNTMWKIRLWSKVVENLSRIHCDKIINMKFCVSQIIRMVLVSKDDARYDSLLQVSDDGLWLPNWERGNVNKTFGSQQEPLAHF